MSNTTRRNILKSAGTLAALAALPCAAAVAAPTEAVVAAMVAANDALPELSKFTSHTFREGYAMFDGINNLSIWETWTQKTGTYYTVHLSNKHETIERNLDQHLGNQLRIAYQKDSPNHKKINQILDDINRDRLI